MEDNYKMENYEIHKVAKRYPAMSKEELGGLKSSLMKEQRNPIYIYKTEDGYQIIDGRNRYNALRQIEAEDLLTYEPEFKEIDIPEEQLEKFVDDLNLHRRHLTSTQRAVIARRCFLPLRQEEATQRMKTGGKDKGSQKSLQAEVGKAIEFAARDANTNSDYVNRAGRIENASAELYKLLEEGKINIMDACKVIKWDKDKKTSIVQKLQEGTSFKEFIKKSKSPVNSNEEKPAIKITVKYGIEIPEEIINQLREICKGEVVIKNLKMTATNKQIEKVKEQMGSGATINSELESPQVF